MALTMQVIGCSSSSINGATLIGVRGSPSLCRRAKNLSSRSAQVCQLTDICYHLVCELSYCE